MSVCLAVCCCSMSKPSQAVDKAMDFLSVFMNVAGALSVSSVVEMLASLVLTVRVVTVPIIMRWVWCCCSDVLVCATRAGSSGAEVVARIFKK